MSRRLFIYNYEKHSAKDIAAYAESLGHPCQFYDGVLVVSSTRIMIRFPAIDSIIKSNFSPILSKSGSVYWDTEVKLPLEYLNPELDESDQVKIFVQLRRKFVMSKGEYPKAIKDLDWIKSMQKKKSWWPF